LTARPSHRRAFFLAAALLTASSAVARAQGTAPLGAVAAPVEPIMPAAPTDAAPGSPIPPGVGLSPEAPQVGPAPGGRAPSFGAPLSERLSAASFRIGGRIYGWEAIGIGEKPANATPGYSGTALHMPLLSNGKIPFWGGSGASLNLQYGTPFVLAYVQYYFRVNGPEYQGYTAPNQGPAFGTAYLLLTPSPIGTLRLQFRVGAFTEPYAGPGQWGWGIFGPLLDVRGWGETTNGEWDITRDVRLTFNHGLLVNPGVPEGYARGDYNSWLETGVSGFTHHAHLGLVLNNQWVLRLHYASAYSTDERKYLKTFLNDPPGDGRFDTYLAEVRWQGNPWGQWGVSGGLYNFKYAASVGDGIWWAVDFTQGAREMINKFLGPNSHGNGQVAVVGAEYDFSVSSILWWPRSFTGQAPDLRVAIAGMLTKTIATDDPIFDNATGYYGGIETEYRMTSIFSFTLATYAEHRDSNIGASPATFEVYSVNPGIAFHTDWLSTDRIQLIYGRRWYSHAADPNSAQPLDRNMIALGGYITF
jgi:hypothetical protein